MTATHVNGRRYDIDWLRSLAFFLLIFYHIGMYYVMDWGWHIKSDVTFKWLQDVMILTNPWRMSLLFFISAMALALVQHKYSASALLTMRTKRLFIPLLFGMFVIVVPQVYIEGLSQNLIEPGYWKFWGQYSNPNTDLLRDHHTAIGLLTWNHLWFLPYLWIYSILIVAMLPVLNRFADSSVAQKTPMWLWVVVLILAYALIRQNLHLTFKQTHALVDDWYNNARYFFIFLAGYVLARQGLWWDRIIQLRFVFLALAICGYSFLIADRHLVFETLASGYGESVWIRSIYNLISSINHWSWILACVGLAGAYLRKPSKSLSYSNQAILPWYMFHQTLIIVFAWYLKPSEIHPGLEFILILLATISACWLGYEIVKRVSVLRFLFGLKSA